MFTVITTAANEDVAAVHDRMPVILPKAQVRKWLERPAVDLLCPAVAGALVGTPVSSRVNDVANDDEGVLGPPEPEAPAKQLRLF
jgi:putative SOS response-associated peptidase YedK